MRTNLSSSNPELLHPESEFNKEWKGFILGMDGGTTFYYSSGNFFNDALIEHSKKYPLETFTGETWNDSDYYESIKYTLFIQNGKCIQLMMEPNYTYQLPTSYDVESEMLLQRFVKHLEVYLKRIDVIKEDPLKGTYFDFLNDREEKDGFRSFYTITWENDKHIFTATKRFTSYIVVDYQKKDFGQESFKEPEKGQPDGNQHDSDYELPF
jgi:hypothetical protein